MNSTDCAMIIWTISSAMYGPINLRWPLTYAREYGK